MTMRLMDLVTAMSRCVLMSPNNVIYMHVCTAPNVGPTQITQPSMCLSVAMGLFLNIAI